jgi:hypothetical protein
MCRHDKCYIRISYVYVSSEWITQTERFESKLWNYGTSRGISCIIANKLILILCYYVSYIQRTWHCKGDSINLVKHQEPESEYVLPWIRDIHLTTKRLEILQRTPVNKAISAKKYNLCTRSYAIHKSTRWQGILEYFIKIAAEGWRPPTNYTDSIISAKRVRFANKK